MLTKQQKAEWVAALRSGKYQQGKRFLQNKDNQFCCLGVLCDLHPDLVTWMPSIDPYMDHILAVTELDEATGTLPPELTALSGLIGAGSFTRTQYLNEYYEYDDNLSKEVILAAWKTMPMELAKEYSSLANMNDIGLDFGVIANVIEQYLETSD